MFVSQEENYAYVDNAVEGDPAYGIKRAYRFYAMEVRNTPYQFITECAVD